MESINKSKSILSILCLIIGACSFFSKGYFNEYGQYVPKHPNFYLKDKPKHMIPYNLDTINVYKLHLSYYLGIETYPSDFYEENSGLLRYASYMKFYKNGRCLSFGADPYEIMENDLNPNNSYASKNYYYSKDGRNFKVETYFYNQGHGYYMISKYKINKTGDTLTRISKNSKEIYVRELLPKHWQKYPVDW